MQNYTVNTTALNGNLMQSRVLKSPKEINLLRLISQIDSDAHVTLMQQSKPGLYEYHMESLFLYETYNCGCRQQAYIPIVGSGYNSAVLHYNMNSRQMQAGDLLLVDAAAEYVGYASDITRTYPVNGQWTAQQRIIYSIVLNAQQTCIDMLKPGANWSVVASQATTSILQGLLDAGIIVGNMSDLLSNGISRLFYMHGLGHFVGLDVHDTYSIGNRLLQSGMVLTVEPGVYFNEALLEGALANPKQAIFLNAELLAEYTEFGGIRIEDVVAITDTGYELLSNAPRQIADIENVMLF